MNAEIHVERLNKDKVKTVCLEEEQFRAIMWVQSVLLVICLCGSYVFGVAASSCEAQAEAHPGYDICEVGVAPYRDERRVWDISHAYTPDLPVWDDPEGLGDYLWLAKSMKNGSLANNSEMKMGTHTGTHVDAPGHVFQEYYEGGFDVDTLDLKVLNGHALLVDVPRDTNITAKVMEALNIPRGVRRVLFRTLNTDRRLMWKRQFDTSYVGFMKDGAQWLVDNTDIKFVGIDYLSVAAYDDLIPSHLVLLESKVVHTVAGRLFEIAVRLQKANGEVNTNQISPYGCRKRAVWYCSRLYSYAGSQSDAIR